MYVPFQDAKLVPVRIEAGTWSHGAITLPRVDAVAARDDQGRLWLSLTNVDPARPAQIDVAIDGMAVRAVSGETLTGPRIDSVNTFDAPTTVSPRPLAATIANGRLRVTLEPKSVSVLSLQP